MENVLLITESRLEFQIIDFPMNHPALRYEGFTINGVPSENGSMKYKNGDEYTGSFEKGEKKGFGKTTFGNISTALFHRGLYENDVKNGNGTMIWKNGDLYEGDFKNDQLHGYGIHRVIQTDMSILLNVP